MLTGVVVPVCSLSGTVYGADGTTIKSTTDVVEHFKTKSFIKKSNDIMDNLKHLIEQMQTVENNYQETIEFFQEYFKLENDKASSIMNTFFAMSNKLRKGVEKAGSIGVLITILAVANPCSSDYQSTAAVGQDTETKVAGAVKKGGSLAAEIAKPGAMTDLKVGIAIYDIVSLVQKWDSAHPTTEAIENVLTKLIQIETFIQSELDAMIDTMDEAELPNVGNTSDSDDKVRIYDKTTDTIKEILQSLGLNGISRPEDHRYRSVPDLVNLIQMILETTGKREKQQYSANIQFDFEELVGRGSPFILSSYFLMIDLIHVLITLHGAVFVKSKAPAIELKVPPIQTSIIFSCNERNYFRELFFPIYTIMKVPLEESNQLCCIYRFHCIECERQENNEFNYVGQSRNFKPYCESHTGHLLSAWVDNENKVAAHEDGVPVPEHVASSLLDEHPVQVHSKKHKFSEIYEVDIVYNLQENFTNTTSRVRHSWEVYYQWLFKARIIEGSGSRR